jgi:CheY-like chemotaxis protein
MPVTGGTADVLAATDVAGEAVLHIEDNPSNQLLVEGVLQQRPAIRLMAATEGGRGLDLAREYRPMLILLDLDLPDQRGEQVLRSLLEDPRTADIPVVVLTADASTRQAKQLLAAGATAYLTKPLDVKGLLRMIDEAHGARTEASVGAN